MNTNLVYLFETQLDKFSDGSFRYRSSQYRQQSTLKPILFHLLIAQQTDCFSKTAGGAGNICFHL